MAERRPPGFNVDLGFYDSDEVLSIPRKIRAAAIGVWTLCGAYSANKLSDGYVSAEALRDRGCTPAIRSALIATTPEPLWEDAGEGAVRFTRWPKWQRTAGEIKAYREAEAERKRKAREAKKQAAEELLQTDVDATWSPRGRHVSATWSPDGDQMDATHEGRNRVDERSTSGNGKTSGRTSDGHPTEDGDPKTETETETNKEAFGHLRESATEGDPRASGIAATPAADLVRSVIPRDIPAATQTALRHQASAMLHDGTPASVVEESLRDWLAKTGVGPGILPSLAADVVKRRNGHANNGSRGEPTSKMRTAATLAAEVRAEENAQFATAATKELR